MYVITESMGGNRRRQGDELILRRLARKAASQRTETTNPKTEMNTRRKRMNFRANAARALRLALIARRSIIWSF
jgi:hypothetical protein